MTNRTTLLGLSTLLVMGTIGTASAASSGAASGPRWREPVITYTAEPNPQAAETVDWAIDQYRQAGLQLPDLTISFKSFCSGKGALYHVGKRSIDFCRINKRRVLHELAHAWDDTSGSVDRDAFLKLRGLTVWWGGTGMPSDEQGAEHLAEIMAWGLMGADPSNVPDLPHNSLTELTEAFDFLNGTV